MTILDTETISQPEDKIRALIPAFNPEKVALGNAKKPDTVASIIEEARLTHGNDIVAKAALRPEYGEIAIIGLMIGEEVHQLHSNKEINLLVDAWELLDRQMATTGGSIVGFNIKGFDLPFMVKRSWILGVTVPRRVFNARKPKYPWNESVVDLLEVYRCGDYQAKSGGLSQVCKVLGIADKTNDGSKFGELWGKDKTAALDYNKQDLIVTSQVAERVL